MPMPGSICNVILLDSLRRTVAAGRYQVDHGLAHGLLGKLRCIVLFFDAAQRLMNGCSHHLAHSSFDYLSSAEFVTKYQEEQIGKEVVQFC